MFVEEIDKNELRQGDIIQGLFYPELNCSDLHMIGTPDKNLTNLQLNAEVQPHLLALTENKPKEGLAIFTAQVKVFYGYFILITQCCDIAKRDKGKPTLSAFVVSPLLEIPYQIRKDTERLTELQANNQGSFINFFYIHQHQPLSQDNVIDFNRVVALPRAQYDFALSRKVLQMTDKDRVRFKLKLGSHFARPTQEERDAQIYPDS